MPTTILVVAVSEITIIAKVFIPVAILARSVIAASAINGCLILRATTHFQWILPELTQLC